MVGLVSFLRQCANSPEMCFRRHDRHEEHPLKHRKPERRYSVFDNTVKEGPSGLNIKISVLTKIPIQYTTLRALSAVVLCPRYAILYQRGSSIILLS